MYYEPIHLNPHRTQPTNFDRSSISIRSTSPLMLDTMCMWKLVNYKLHTISCYALAALLLTLQSYSRFAFAQRIDAGTSVGAKVGLCQMTYCQVEMPRVQVNHCLRYVVLVAAVQLQVACVVEVIPSTEIGFAEEKQKWHKNRVKRGEKKSSVEKETLSCMRNDRQLRQLHWL